LLRGKKWRKKRAKGPNALWKPATRKVVPLSLHSFFREGIEIQLLRWRFKEKRQHERRTDSTSYKTQTYCLFPCDSKNFKQDGKKKLLLFTPAARGVCRREINKIIDVFLPSPL
jgi:hypothetical protein